MDMTHICPHLKFSGPFQAAKGTSFELRLPHPLRPDLFIYLEKDFHISSWGS